MKNLIIIPTYNEVENLELLVRKIREFDSDSSILIIEDNSPDGTGQVADRLKKEMSQIDVIHRSGKLGLGTAHVLGLNYAREYQYDTTVTMDCDFTHKPADIPRLRKSLEESAFDMVVGSRFIHERGVAAWPWMRRLITYTAHAATTVLLGLRVDATNSFRIFRVNRIPYPIINAIKVDGYAFMFELIFQCHYHGLSIGQIPVELPVRADGKSKFSLAEIYKAIKRLLELSWLRLRVGAGGVRPR